MEHSIRATILNGQLDEVRAERASVLLQCMDSTFELIIETATERACFTIRARAAITAEESWRELIE